MENWGKFGFVSLQLRLFIFLLMEKLPRPALEAQAFEEYPRPARIPTAPSIQQSPGPATHQNHLEQFNNNRLRFCVWDRVQQSPGDLTIS